MFKKALRASIILALACLPVQAMHLQSEKEYVRQHCAGIQEYALKNGCRVDCLSSHAEEFDFAPKFYECITQSLFYAMETGKPAKCVLIQEKVSDALYVDRAKSLVKFYNLPVFIDLIQAF